MPKNGAAPVPVCIDFAELSDHKIDLSVAIEEAFGKNGLGLVTIKNVPDYTTLRKALLPLAARLAQLPEDQKTALEDPLSSYNFGWSQGKEKLENGAYDTSKASFYANPLTDRPTDDPKLIEHQPAYCRPNIWPTDNVPELEQAFKALGKLIYDVGMLVTEQCSKYLVSTKVIDVKPPLPEVLSRSNCHKGRLLCYLPLPETPTSNTEHSNGSTTTAAEATATAVSIENDTKQQQWCGWHTDHGSITGLASAMYTDAAGNEVPCPDPQAGLYIKNRHGEMVRIVIPPDHIAFQLGEVFQILSGGTLVATPHCVVAPRPGHHHRFSLEENQKQRQQVYRNTFALFMQPRWDEILHCPDAIDPGNVGIDVWNNKGTSFGDFSKKRFENYY